MASVSANGSFGKALSEVLGIGELRVRSIVLKVESGCIVTADINYMPDESRLFDALKVLRAYEWREDRPERDATALNDEYRFTTPATDYQLPAEAAQETAPFDASYCDTEPPQ